MQTAEEHIEQLHLRGKGWVLARDVRGENAQDESQESEQMPNPDVPCALIHEHIASDTVH